MSNTPNADSVAASAFSGLSELQVQMVIAYLLRQIAGSTMTPNQLAVAAACFCSDARSLTMQQVYLLNQILANGGVGGGAVSQLVAGAGIALSPSSGVGAVTISAWEFTSAQFTLSQTSWQAAHGLGAVPTGVRAVLVCTTTDLYAVGREIDVTAFWNTANTSQGFSVTADATNVYAICSSNPVGAEGDYLLANGAQVNSFNHFLLKFYARL